MWRAGSYFSSDHACGWVSCGLEIARLGSINEAAPTGVAHPEGRDKPAVSRVSQELSIVWVRKKSPRTADLEVGDTAGLETCATPRETGRIQPGPGRTNIFIYPPFKFNIVDVLLTNFHLPRSTLLMLVSAFAAPGEMRGRDLTLAAYQQAIAKRYRFFSYGDAMLIL